MFRHVVLLKWDEHATGGDRQAVRDALTRLPDEIPVIRDYRVGVDAGLTADNFDMVVVADFDDQAGYAAYRDHPAHQKVVSELIRPILADRASVQHPWTTALPTDLPG